MLFEFFLGLVFMSDMGVGNKGDDVRRRSLIKVVVGVGIFFRKAFVFFRGYVKCLELTVIGGFG